VDSFQFFDEKGNAFKFRDSLTSEKISLSVAGRAAKGKPGPPPSPAPGGNSFNACTDAVPSSRTKNSAMKQEVSDFVLSL